ncbi:MAG: hypothetical protein ACXW0Q_01195 [Methylovulum sp.]
MKPIEIVELIKKESPELLGKMSEGKAAKIIRAALVQLGKQLEETDEGVLKVAGLGNFQIKQREKEKEGKKITTKVITLRVIKPKKPQPTK